MDKTELRCKDLGWHSSFKGTGRNINPRELHEGRTSAELETGKWGMSLTRGEAQTGKIPKKRQHDEVMTEKNSDENAKIISIPCNCCGIVKQGNEEIPPPHSKCTQASSHQHVMSLTKGH